MMQRTIARSEFEKDSQAILDDVIEHHVPYVLTSEDQPRVALLPYEDFLRLERLSSEDQTLREFDAMWARMSARTADISEEEVALDVAAARAEIPC